MKKIVLSLLIVFTLIGIMVSTVQAEWYNRTIQPGKIQIDSIKSDSEIDSIKSDIELIKSEIELIKSDIELIKSENKLTNSKLKDRIRNLEFENSLKNMPTFNKTK